MNRKAEILSTDGERLGKLNLFAGMSPELIAEIVQRLGGEIRRFAAGEVVVYEGTKAKWVVGVISGRLTVFECGANGKRHPVRIVNEGHLFGATMIADNHEYYPGMARADEPTVALFLDIGKIAKIWQVEKYAKLFTNLYKAVSQEVLGCWRKMSILSCKRVEDRFMLYLHWYTSEVGESDVRLPFANSEACAEYLGVTRTALSLAVKRLVQRGEIAHPAHGRFVLLGIV